MIAEGIGVVRTKPLRDPLFVRPPPVCDWSCTVEHEEDRTLSLRIGLGYAKGLTKQSAEALVTARRAGGMFRASDLALRIPSLTRKELIRLAEIGALNRLNGVRHRHDALWRVERAGKPEGPLLRDHGESLREDSYIPPLQQMNIEERLVADYAGTGLTVGKSPIHYRRAELQRSNVLSAAELRSCWDGEFVRAAGCVIARQRPGTAKGFIFISWRMKPVSPTSSSPQISTTGSSIRH